MEERLRFSPAVGFILRAAGWIVVLFGTLRLGWVQKHLMIPFAGLQEQIACGIAGTSPDALIVGQSCTGSDAMALCLGAILAFPATWRQKLVGGALGFALITAVNTLRIGTLSLVVDNRDLFQLLHVYLWPAVIIVIAAGYVFLWMARAGREVAEVAEVKEETAPGALSPAGKRFFVLMIVLVTLYYLASSWLLKSELTLSVARWAAGSAGVIMSLVGVESEVTGHHLRTPHGYWVVSQACVLTPLIAVYLAAVLAAPLSPLRRAMAVLAAVPLFVCLAMARLLVLALPSTMVRSHNVAVHAFYQFLAAAVVLGLIVWRQTSSARQPLNQRLSRLGLALGAGLAVGFVLGAIDAAWLRPVLAGMPAAVHLGHAYADPQGAALILPSFQFGFLAALCIGLGAERNWRKMGTAVLRLGARQATFLVALGEMSAHAGVSVPVVLIRGYALLVPVVLVGWLLRPIRVQSSEQLSEAVTQSA
jgi:exosortase/archaeosortase family protein